MGKLEKIKELIGSSDLVEQEMNSLRGGNAKEFVAVCSKCGEQPDLTGKQEQEPKS